MVVQLAYHHARALQGTLIAPDVEARRVNGLSAVVAIGF